MTTPQPPLITLLESTGRAYARDELAEQFSIKALRSAVSTGAVTRMAPGVYAATLHAEAIATRAHAAHLWSPTGVIIGATAAHAWGFIDDPPVRVRITAVRGRNRPEATWLVLNRLTRTIPPVRIESIPDAPILVATPEYTIATAFGEVGRSQGSELVFRAIRERITSPEQIGAAMAALPRVADRSGLASVVGAAAQGAESFLETVGLRRTFARREFAGFVRQHRVRVNGHVYRLDMCDLPTRTIIELDGGRHGEPGRREHDIERDAVLAARGFVTLRFSYWQVMDRPKYCRDVVRRTLRAREAELGIQRQPAA